MQGKTTDTLSIVYTKHTLYSIYLARKDTSQDELQNFANFYTLTLTVNLIEPFKSRHLLEQNINDLFGHNSGHKITSKRNYS